jgi:hypothetical protein
MSGRQEADEDRAAVLADLGRAVDEIGRLLALLAERIREMPQLSAKLGAPIPPPPPDDRADIADEMHRRLEEWRRSKT